MPITVTNLTCVYGAGTPFETTALRDVSVTVENGSFVGILGRTGCGKSTLIQIMAGRRHHHARRAGHPRPPL